MDFYNTIEQTLVNGDIPLKYLTVKTNPLKSKFHSFIKYLLIGFEEYCDKKHKADYLNLQIKFVD